MKSPKYHAIHLRKLGQHLEDIAPEAPACMEEAATQLEILYRIGQMPGGLKLIDDAVNTLIKEGHETLAYAPGKSHGNISQFKPEHQTDKNLEPDTGFNVSRN